MDRVVPDQHMGDLSPEVEEGRADGGSGASHREKEAVDMVRPGAP